MKQPIEKYEYTITPIPFQEKSKKPKKIWINIVLFILTVFTTTFMGAVLQGGKVSFHWYLGGLKFSIPLMLILGVHEMGHYIASRRHDIDATLPYFIPAPTIIGTFGAFIKIREPIVNRRELMDVGAAGPLAGFVVAIPVLIWGLFTSHFVPVKEGFYGIKLGNSILMWLASRIILGNPPAGSDLFLSPPAFAAWIGLFITSLNLLPIGQLDGGHIIYALMGERSRRISWIVFLALIPLGFFWKGWVFWASVIFFFLGIKHPITLDIFEPLDKKRKIIGYISIFVFIITFIPVPFSQ